VGLYIGEGGENNNTQNIRGKPYRPPNKMGAENVVEDHDTIE
jgi:hypothetical protein